MIIKVNICFNNIIELGAIVLGISGSLYLIGVLLFFDRALLMLSNVFIYLMSISFYLSLAYTFWSAFLKVSCFMRGK